MDSIFSLFDPKREVEPVAFHVVIMGGGAIFAEAIRTGSVLYICIASALGIYALLFVAGPFLARRFQTKTSSELKKDEVVDEKK